MSEYDIGQTDTAGMDTAVDDWSASPKTLDSPEGKESVWDNRNFDKYLGYYKTIPEYKKPIDALSVWTVGKGWTADARVTAILERVTGNGKQSFQIIMEAHQTMKKVNGDSYTQIIRDDSAALINFKLLNPGRIKTIFNSEGIIIRYELMNISKKKVIHKFRPAEILHSMNEPIGDETHGNSVLDVSQWGIDAKNEAMSDWRRILHRNLAGVRIIEVEEDDPTKLAVLETMWAKAVNKGDVMILPKGTAAIMPTAPPTNPENWIRYLDGTGYQNVGVPKIILGGSQEFTEASSKIGYITFDPVYTNEQLELEAELWNQVGIRVKFNRPAELGGLMTESEEKNTGQVGFQANEVTPTVTRNE